MRGVVVELISYTLKEPVLSISNDEGSVTLVYSDNGNLQLKTIEKEILVRQMKESISFLYQKSVTTSTFFNGRESIWFSQILDFSGQGDLRGIEFIESFVGGSEWDVFVAAVECLFDRYDMVPSKF